MALWFVYRIFCPVCEFPVYESPVCKSVFVYRILCPVYEFPVYESTIQKNTLAVLYTGCLMCGALLLSWGPLQGLTFNDIKSKV